jgi:hypothetical protein
MTAQRAPKEPNDYDDREVEKRLRRIPNVGPAMARDLLLLGMRSVEDAVGKDPDVLYEQLCTVTGNRQDPCVRDVFAAVVAYAGGGPSRPWWEFTSERKVRTPSTSSRSGS